MNDLPISFLSGDDSIIIFEKFVNSDIVYDSIGKSMLLSYDKEMKSLGWGVDTNLRHEMGGLWSLIWYFYLKALRSVVSLLVRSTFSVFSHLEKHEEDVLLKTEEVADDILVE